MRTAGLLAGLAVFALLGLGVRPLEAAVAGVTDTEITIGQSLPYSGPASAYSGFGKSETAYMRMVNDKGGINGRKINLISVDDGYLPPRAMEQTRKLVEEDGVFFNFSTIGTASNVVIRKYLNEKHVPQIFAASGLTSFGDHKRYPWTIAWQPPYEIEGQLFVRYILKQKPNARIAVLYQNDDLGKDYVRGIQRELGDRAKTMLVATQSYEITDPTVDSQMVKLQESGADAFINISTPKFAALSIRKAYELSWRPLQLLSYASASVSSVMLPAGVERSTGVISSTYYKDPTDPRWADDPEYRDYLAFLAKYLPGADKGDVFYLIGYMMAETVTQLLEHCGHDLTRENVMRQVAGMDYHVPMLLPGVNVKTSPESYYPVTTLQLQRFDGKTFALFGEPVTIQPAPSP